MASASASSRHSLRRPCALVCCGLNVLLLVGCTTFDVPPYSVVIRDTDARTRAAQANPPADLTPNRAALMSDHSQGEIKRQLAELWHPSLNPLAWANYNGLIATRYSQLDTTPGPMFSPGELVLTFLGQETRVPYIAAFHPGKRLPLVVGVSGINGTVDGKITVEALEACYKSGDFHVIHLESLTSVSQQERNNRPFLGGLPEAILLYKVVAELRKRPEFADQIDQVHLVGISFGGLVCAIAAHCEDEFRSGVIDGAVLAYSPPSDLKLLFDNIAKLRLIHDHIHDSYLVAGRERFLRHAALDLTEKEFDELTFDSYIRKGAFPYVRRVYPALQAEYPGMPPIRDADELYKYSSVRPILDQLGVPFFFLYAHDDPVLSPEQHYHELLMNCRNPLVEGLLLEDGGHLGFDAVCGFPFTAQVAERYFRYWSVSLPRTSSPPRDVIEAVHSNPPKSDAGSKILKLKSRPSAP